MKQNLITLAVALTLAGGALAAPGPGREFENKIANDKKAEQSVDQSNKISASSDVGQQLSRGLAAILPSTATYVRRVYRKGVSLEQITSDRVGPDRALYMVMREAELRKSKQPEARWAADLLGSCKSEDCVMDFAWRETLGLALQSAHAAQSSTFGEQPCGGYRCITDIDFDNWLVAVVRHADYASFVEKLLWQKQQGSQMSLNARRLKLVQDFYTMPVAELPYPVTYEFMYTILPDSSGSPIRVQVNNQVTYSGEADGLHIKGNGGDIFGNGFAQAEKLTLTDDSTGSTKVSSSKTNTSSVTTKRAEVENGPRDNKPIFKKKN